MATSDDPFLTFLTSCSDGTVRFHPGSGGFEDALSSICFMMLCDRRGLSITIDDDRSSGGLAPFGFVAAATGAPHPLRSCLPFDMVRAESIADLARCDAELFFCDPESLRIAELQGVPPERRRLCRHLASHLDLTDFEVPPDGGAGTLRFAVRERISGDGDGIALFLSGQGGRWGSRQRCHAAIQQVIASLRPYAEVETDSLGVAILAANLGRRAVLRDVPGRGSVARQRAWLMSEYPDIVVEPMDAAAADGAPAALGPTAAPGEPIELDRRERAARREAQSIAQERDALTLKVTVLQEKLDAGFASAMIAAERDARGTRLMPARLAEERIAEAGTRERDLRAECVRLEALARERERDHAGRVAALEGAILAERHQVSVFREALDEAIEARQHAEGRAAQALALVDRSAAAEADADRIAGAMRDRLDAVLSSTSWTLTRPIRAAVRALRRLAGPDRDARDAGP